MLTVGQEIVSRSARQATTRKFWVLEAADYLVACGAYAIEEYVLAIMHAKRLAARNTDEGGELMESPSKVVDDDLAYEAS